MSRRCAATCGTQAMAAVQIIATIAARAAARCRWRMRDTEGVARTKIAMGGSKAGTRIYQRRPTPALVLRDKRGMSSQVTATRARTCSRRPRIRPATPSCRSAPHLLRGPAAREGLRRRSRRERLEAIRVGVLSGAAEEADGLVPVADLLGQPRAPSELPGLLEQRERLVLPAGGLPCLGQRRWGARAARTTARGPSTCSPRSPAAARARPGPSPLRSAPAAGGTGRPSAAAGTRAASRPPRGGGPGPGAAPRRAGHPAPPAGPPRACAPGPSTPSRAARSYALRAALSFPARSQASPA